ncbi:MAG TPA: DMT family transporter [Allosphingosinicella sp.]|jgi:drug/metabolite transporter (DMT)-like permease
MLPSTRRAALLIALAGFAILSVGDAVVKSMAGDWPGTAVAALRYCFGALGLAVFVAAKHGRAGFNVPRLGAHLGRGAAVALATICFFMAVMAMPLADATAVQFTSPILTAMLAPLVLKERSPPAVWLATMLAFAGVLVVLRPNLLELGLVAFYPLGAALGMSWLMMLNRMTAGDAPVMVMQFVLAAVAAPLLVAAAGVLHLVGGAPFRIDAPSLEVVLKCLFVAFSATTGHALIFAAVLRANAAAVAPMTYVQLLVAAAIGWAWFAEAPDVATFAGAALIVAGGLWLLRAQREPPVAETPD